MAGQPNTAIVHDYLTQCGGAERVVLEMSRTFPDATIWTSIYDPRRTYRAFQDKAVRCSFVNRLPWAKAHHRAFLLAYPAAFKSLRLPPCDLVLSSSTAFAKGVRVPSGAVHVCYCNTPMRFAWNLDTYIAGHSRLERSKRAVVRPLMASMRRWDIEQNDNVDVFIANSLNISKRIALLYGRHSVVVHPPVDLALFRQEADCDDYYLVLSRLIQYKRVDLAVRACSELGRKLIVVGQGPEERRLRAMAGPSVTFLGRVDDSRTRALLARCRGLLLCGEEDFGIVPLEAMASGRPVVAYAAGGALETVQDGVTGTLFPQQTLEDTCSSISRFETMEFTSSACAERAALFSTERFRAHLLEVCELALQGCRPTAAGLMN
jgi:glycosyltransferase involved in cell wall biosynthesis